MSRLVEPKVYLVGSTRLEEEGLHRYLLDSGNEEFWEDVIEAKKEGISESEILVSTYSKLCYKALTVGKNINISRVRSISGNLEGTTIAAHGSVFRHAYLNFIISDCSRIFTHELVRHVAGTAFSQNSGRYIRLENLQVAFDPILEPSRKRIERMLENQEKEIYMIECEIGLRIPKSNPDAEASYKTEDHWEPIDDSFAIKKKKTSAVRRFAFNGQINEIGYSANLDSIRHTVMVRTAPEAEWEIRLVFSKIYELLNEKFPKLFYGAKVRLVDGVSHVYGMKLHPYERYVDEFTHS